MAFLSAVKDVFKELLLASPLRALGERRKRAAADDAAPPKLSKRRALSPPCVPRPAPSGSVQARIASQGDAPLDGAAGAPRRPAPGGAPPRAGADADAALRLGGGGYSFQAFRQPTRTPPHAWRQQQEAQQRARQPSSGRRIDMGHFLSRAGAEGVRLEDRDVLRRHAEHHVQEQHQQQRRRAPGAAAAPARPEVVDLTGEPSSARPAGAAAEWRAAGAAGARPSLAARLADDLEFQALHIAVRETAAETYPMERRLAAAAAPAPDAAARAAAQADAAVARFKAAAAAGLSEAARAERLVRAPDVEGQRRQAELDALLERIRRIPAALPAAPAAEAAAAEAEAAPPGKHVPPELPAEAFDEYQELVAQPHSKELVRKLGGIEVLRKDLATLARLQWLNDEIVNVTVALLQRRDARWHAEAPRGAPGRRACHFFSSFFCNKLYQDAGRYDYANVRRWTAPKRLQSACQPRATVLECDRIVVPVHQGVHWVTAVADLANRRFVYYDSLRGEDPACLEALAQYVRDESNDKGGGRHADALSWPREFPKDAPQQLNGCDCGMFALLFAEHAARGAEMTFSQEHIDLYRVKAVRDIMALRID